MEKFNTKRLGFGLLGIALSLMLVSVGCAGSVKAPQLTLNAESPSHIEPPAQVAFPEAAPGRVVLAEVFTYDE